MFDLNKFIMDNLINGFGNYSFTKEQVSIFAVNYMAKGLLDEDDIIEINIKIEEIIANRVED